MYRIMSSVQNGIKLDINKKRYLKNAQMLSN